MAIPVEKFQFHSGTIRRTTLSLRFRTLRDFNSTQVRLEGPLVLRLSGRSRFQFHSGTIRRGTQLRDYYQGSDFNSTQVRLEAREATGIRSAMNLFQFHSGTIRSPQRASRRHYRDYFNSTQVRLEAIDDHRSEFHHFISIPLRYD